MVKERPPTKPNSGKPVGGPPRPTTGPGVPPPDPEGESR